jgi:hypothetical protein
MSSSDDVTGTDWTSSEVDLIVADYFAMLQLELLGQSFNKAARNRALQALTGRVHGSIERKHQNISAVLVRLGLPWIKGYKPLPNFQGALLDGIGRYLATEGQPVFSAAASVATVVAESSALWIGPPPMPAAEDLKETEPLRRLIRKFDPAERDARNRALGKQGEATVLAHERAQLLAAGRTDLERKLEWTSETRGDGAGYDIRSFDLDGTERLIEVKTTNGSALTPFFLSENERSFSEERPEAFRLVRLYTFTKAPAAFELAPPLGSWLTLNPTNYRASLAS